MDDAGFKKISFDTPSPKQENINPQVVAAESGKIDFNSPIKPMKRKFFKIGKRNFGIVGVIAGLLLLVLLYTAFQGFGIYTQSKKTLAQARLAADAAKTQNVELAKVELVKTKAEAEKLDKKISSVGYLKFVPLLGGYVSDADHMVTAGVHGINAGIITTESLIPYADVLGLKGQGTFSGGSAEDRIRLAVSSLDKITPRIDDIEREI